MIDVVHSFVNEMDTTRLHWITKDAKNMNISFNSKGK